MASWMCVRPALLGLLTVAATLVQAQSAPPLKPGLWQVRSDRLVDGKPVPDPMAQLQNLPPEMRKQLEASLKQQGVDLSGPPGTTRFCMTRESIEQGRWYQDESGCKTDYLTRTSSLWKWRAVCPQPPSEHEGEARIASPERYTVKLKSVSQLKGKPTTTEMTMESQWQSADCGKVKPINLPAARKP